MRQQYAVNKFLSIDNKIFSVNGPPGTGKTTLLKDIFAEIIRKKAIKIYDLHTEKKLFFEDEKINAEIIKEYAIIVTSSNNTAVENITAELPAVKDKFTSVKYFDDIKEIKGVKEEVGLLTAILGKKDNFDKFYKFFKKDYFSNLNEADYRKPEDIYDELKKLEVEIRLEYKEVSKKLMKVDEIKKIERYITKITLSLHDLQDINFYDNEIKRKEDSLLFLKNRSFLNKVLISLNMNKDANNLFHEISDLRKNKNIVESKLNRIYDENIRIEK